MGIGMNHWEWEGMGSKKDIPAHLYYRPNRDISDNKN